MAEGALRDVGTGQIEAHTARCSSSSVGVVMVGQVGRSTEHRVERTLLDPGSQHSGSVVSE